MTVSWSTDTNFKLLLIVTFVLRFLHKMFLAVNSKIALADIFALTMKYLLTSYQYHYNSEKENKSC